jgi:hypothetical protein
MRRKFAIGVLLAALTCVGSARISAQDSAPGDWQAYLFQEGPEVYDVVNHIVWLRNANLPAETRPDGTNFRFGLPLCPDLTIEPTVSCVNASGSFGGRSL